MNGVLTQPFLSANLDFAAEPGFADLTDADGPSTGLSTDGRVVARSAIVTDPVSGQRFGVVGATTPDLPTISSPRDVAVTPDGERRAESLGVLDAVELEEDLVEGGEGRITLVP